MYIYIYIYIYIYDKNKWKSVQTNTENGFSSDISFFIQGKNIFRLTINPL